MHKTRFENILRTQTAVAQKVFAVIPQEASWTVDTIYFEVRRKQVTTVNRAAVENCIRELTEAGLLKKSGKDKYQPIQPHTHVAQVIRRAPEEPQQSEVVEKPTVAVEPTDAATTDNSVQRETVANEASVSIEPVVCLLSKDWVASILNSKWTNYRSDIPAELITKMMVGDGGRYNYSKIHAAVPGSVFRLPRDPKESLHATLFRFRYVRLKHSAKVGRLLEIHVHKTFVDIFVSTTVCRSDNDVPRGRNLSSYNEMVRAIQSAVMISESVASTPATVVTTSPVEATLEESAPASLVSDDIWSLDDKFAWKELVVVGLNRGKTIAEAMADADVFIKRYQAIKIAGSTP